MESTKQEKLIYHSLSRYLDDFKKTKTPFYFYDLDHLEETIQLAKEHSKKLSERFKYKIHFSMKSNFDLVLLKIIKKAGFSIDCFS